MPQIEMLAELGDAVDVAERACNAADAINMTWDDGYREIVDDLIAAKRAYFAALRKPWLDEIKRLEKSRAVYPSAVRVARLWDECERARAKLEQFKSLYGSGLFTAAEFSEVEAAEEAAEGRHEFYYMARCKAIGDAQEFGRTRFAQRFGKRLVTKEDVDGKTYVKVGAKNIDGVRRDVWEEVIS